MKQKVVIVGCGWLGQQLGIVLAEHGFSVFGSRQSAAGLAELPSAIQPILLRLPLAITDVALTEIFSESWLICAIPPSARLQSASHYAEQLQSLVELAIAAGVRGVIHCASTGVYQGLTGDVDEESQVQQGGRLQELGEGFAGDVLGVFAIAQAVAQPRFQPGLVCAVDAGESGVPGELFLMVP